MADKAELLARFDRVLSALRAVIAAETALDPAWEETKKGVEGAFADALCARSRARTAFEDETPTLDVLIITLKDNRYKDPLWPTDSADDAQMLRTVWHFIHDTIAAKKRFAPDDLDAMRNLYAALERAREKVTEAQRPATKFKWTPPMLEGYVFALLKDVEYPNEREAVAWIATRSRKPEPSRTTLRKTWAWQNRLKKTPTPGTTNESQSGVSPDQNADHVASHEEVMDAVLEIQDRLNRQLSDDERQAVEWSIQQTGKDEEEKEKAIGQLLEGFRSITM